MSGLHLLLVLMAFVVAVVVTGYVVKDVLHSIVFKLPVGNHQINRILD